MRDERGGEWRTVQLSSAIKALVVLNLQVRHSSIALARYPLLVEVWSSQVWFEACRLCQAPSRILCCMINIVP